MYLDILDLFRELRSRERSSERVATTSRYNINNIEIHL